MLTPRDFVGIEFLVRVLTPYGPIQRWIRAFDRDDATEQMLEYCLAEDIPPLEFQVI